MLVAHKCLPYWPEGIFLDDKVNRTAIFMLVKDFQSQK